MLLLLLPVACSWFRRQWMAVKLARVYLLVPMQLSLVLLLLLQVAGVNFEEMIA
jgi:hypothetical protein